MAFSIGEISPKSEMKNEKKVILYIFNCQKSEKK